MSLQCARMLNVATAPPRICASHCGSVDPLGESGQSARYRLSVAVNRCPEPSSRHGCVVRHRHEVRGLGRIHAESVAGYAVFVRPVSWINPPASILPTVPC